MSRRADLVDAGKGRKELRDFTSPEFVRMAFVMEEDEADDPSPVRSFGPGAEMTQPDGISKLLPQIGPKMRRGFAHDAGVEI